MYTHFKYQSRSAVSLMYSQTLKSIWAPWNSPGHFPDHVIHCRSVRLMYSRWPLSFFVPFLSSLGYWGDWGMKMTLLQSENWHTVSVCHHKTERVKVPCGWMWFGKRGWLPGFIAELAKPAGSSMLQEPRLPHVWRSTAEFPALSALSGLLRSTDHFPDF